MSSYYVYLLLDPTNYYLPFYIGKGKDLRWQSHLKETTNPENKRKHALIQKIRAAGEEPVHIKWEENMEEGDAYDLEIELIKKFGRYNYDPGGILMNISLDNRPPPASISRVGKKHSEATKKKMSDARRGKTYEEIYGVEEAERLKEIKRNQSGPMLGKHHSKETKKILSDKRKGISYEELYGIERARQLKEDKRQWNLKHNHSFPSRIGIKHSEETKRKMSEAHRGVPQSKNHIAALTKVRQRNYKITNVVSHQNYFIESGRLPKFCESHSLNYSNLMNSKNEDRIFKKCWKIIEIAQAPVIPKKPQIDF